jgi:hypothetical protein
LRRIPMSHRSHVTGFQALQTGLAEHESALERDFVTLASFLDAGAVIASQPVTIAFMHGGRRRKYTPDFQVIWSDGRIDLVEIKYYKDLRSCWTRLRPAFETARTWARRNGATFRIATERSIRGQVLEAAKQLLPLRNAAVDPDLAAQAIAVIGNEDLCITELAARLSAPRTQSVGVIWRLIARRALLVDLSIPIVGTSRISLP